jgi:hypothetical protein
MVKIMKMTRQQLRKLIKEEMQVGIDMLNWNELQVGDLVDVDSDYNAYPKTRIVQKVEDVSRISGNPPGPGFVGVDDHGDEIVFSVMDVVPSSYGKYAMAEHRRLMEFWGKKKEPQKPRSDADTLEQALRVMTQSTESFPEGNGLNYVVWGPFDDPYDKELMQLGQAFTKRLKEVAAEYRAKEDERKG